MSTRERENRDFRWAGRHQHRTASPAHPSGSRKQHSSRPSQFQYPKLPNSTRCCNRWALAICSYGTCQPQITAAYSAGSAQVSECCDFTQEACQEPVPQQCSKAKSIIFLPRLFLLLRRLKRHKGLLNRFGFSW